MPTKIAPPPHSKNAQPPIEVRLLAAGGACPLDSFVMRLNGEAVPAAHAIVGDEHVLTYTPTETLALVTPNVLEVEAREACCNAAGVANVGTLAYTFVVT